MKHTKIQNASIGSKISRVNEKGEGEWNQPIPVMHDFKI